MKGIRKNFSFYFTQDGHAWLTASIKKQIKEKIKEALQNWDPSNFRTQEEEGIKGDNEYWFAGLYHDEINLIQNGSLWTFGFDVEYRYSYSDDGDSSIWFDRCIEIKRVR